MKEETKVKLTLALIAILLVAVMIGIVFFIEGRKRFRIQKSYTVGGITVYQKDGYHEKQTGTKLTDAVEKLLYEKYGEEFVCEQYLYHEEYCMHCDLDAYPVNNPEICFDVGVGGIDHLSLSYDFYYNELFRDETSNLLYPAVTEFNIPKDHFIVATSEMKTSKEININQITNNFAIYLSPSMENRNNVKFHMSDIIINVCKLLPTKLDFFIFLCDEDTPKPENSEQDKILDTCTVYWDDQNHLNANYIVPGGKVEIEIDQDKLK